MIFYPNQSTNRFTRAISLPSEVGSATFKARDTVTLDMKFHNGLAAVALAVDSELVFVIKTGVAAAATTLAIATEWEVVATGHYRASLSLNTEEIIDAIGDLDKLSAVGELTWNEGSGWESSNTLKITLDNDVYKGDEGTPLSLPTPDDWLLGSTAPVIGDVAAVTINPAGADNSIVYTAQAAGSAGNAITIAYATPAAQSATTVGVAGNAITVMPGTKARMVISGELTSNGSTPVVFSEPLTYAGVHNSKAQYYDSEDINSISWDGTKWTIFIATPEARWESSENVATPDLVTTWTPQASETGSPVVTSGISSAAQVIEAVNDSVAAYALVDAAASGTVTGAVASVAATNLTGGVNATLAPPYLRVSGGFLYIQDAGEWKKVELSAL